MVVGNWSRKGGSEEGIKGVFLEIPEELDNVRKILASGKQLKLCQRPSFGELSFFVRNAARVVMLGRTRGVGFVRRKWSSPAATAQKPCLLSTFVGGFRSDPFPGLASRAGARERTGPFCLPFASGPAFLLCFFPFTHPRTSRRHYLSSPQPELEAPMDPQPCVRTLGHAACRNIAIPTAATASETAANGILSQLAYARYDSSDL